MRNKDYREIQISSSMLIFIFMAVLVLGVVVFLLGVSVGKKQFEIEDSTPYPTQSIEQVTEKKPVIPEPVDPISEEIESHKQAQEQRTEKPEAVETKPVPVQSGGELYYIQVGAYSDRSNAQKVVDSLKQLGYPALVVEPSSGDRRLFRVRVGGYENRENAEQIIQRLARDQNKKSADYFIVQE